MQVERTLLSNEKIYSCTETGYISEASMKIEPAIPTGWMSEGIHLSG